jgi:hypothetical protein
MARVMLMATRRRPHRPCGGATSGPQAPPKHTENDTRQDRGELSVFQGASRST